MKPLPGAGDIVLALERETTLGRIVALPIPDPTRTGGRTIDRLRTVLGERVGFGPRSSMRVRTVPSTTNGLPSKTIRMPASRPTSIA